MKGDCDICANGKLPPDSATCVDCGLSRKNYKPMTNYDRLISKTPEELAEYLSSICYDFWKMFVDDPKKMWLDWLKSPVDDGGTE